MERIEQLKLQTEDLESKLDVGLIVREDENSVLVSFHHMMEYYLYAAYYRQDKVIRPTTEDYALWYREIGEAAMQEEKYHAAAKAFKKAVDWNPVDLDALLDLAEAEKHIGHLERFRAVTEQLYYFCASRATMARYYRNMGYYYTSKYKPEIAKVCYEYSNLYYHTENADSELAYLAEAMESAGLVSAAGIHKENELLKDQASGLNSASDGNQGYSREQIAEMQKVLVSEKIEPGPEEKTIRVLYEAGGELLKQGQDSLAKDCFTLVYDITQNPDVLALLEQLDA